MLAIFFVCAGFNGDYVGALSPHFQDIEINNNMVLLTQETLKSMFVVAHSLPSHSSTKKPSQDISIDSVFKTKQLTPYKVGT